MKGEVNARKTECPKGHPYTTENTRFFTTAGGGQGRHCRVCERESLRRQAARRAGRNLVQTIDLHTKDLRAAYQDATSRAVPPEEAEDILRTADETRQFLTKTIEELESQHAASPRNDPVRST